jgi:hypothetical protein
MFKDGEQASRPQPVCNDTSSRNEYSISEKSRANVAVRSDHTCLRTQRDADTLQHEILTTDLFSTRILPKVTTYSNLHRFIRQCSQNIAMSSLEPSYELGITRTPLPGLVA